MKNKKIINIIINMAKFIFTQIEFSKFLSFLKLKMYNRLRIFVEEKLEFLETEFILYTNNLVIESQIKECKKLDFMVTEMYLNDLVV